MFDQWPDFVWNREWEIVWRSECKSGFMQARIYPKKKLSDVKIHFISMFITKFFLSNLFKYTMLSAKKLHNIPRPFIEK